MPNHVKSRLTINASKEELKAIIAKFGNEVPARLNRAYDDTIICKHKTEEHNWGYFDEKTGKFTSGRNENKVERIGIPEEYEMEIEPAYLHFPDFNKVIPQPENIFNGDLGQAEEEMCRREGRPTWYEWNRENWGTKWNSYSLNREDDNVFTFETAWSAVPGIIEKMSLEFPNVEFLYDYADEDTGYNCGMYRFKNGLQNKNIPVGGSKEAYDLAFLLRPNYKEMYVWNEEKGKYGYKES